MIITHPQSKAYDEGWDAVFAKKETLVDVVDAQYAPTAPAWSTEDMSFFSDGLTRTCGCERRHSIGAIPPSPGLIIEVRCVCGRLLLRLTCEEQQ